ncbi:MAG: DUF1841 family protein [Zetaproteobacteria bacterium]|nr:DUF1841 family protein [Zetaproteobacteria bacterium]
MVEQPKPNRETLHAHRKIFWDAWQKALADLPMSALEVRIARVIRMHPEYHHFFNDLESFLDRDFQANDGMNPYLHLSLHLTLEEQAASKQPIEVAKALEYLIAQKGRERHDALHVLLEILAETIYRSQREGREIDPLAYIQEIKAIIQP